MKLSAAITAALLSGTSTSTALNLDALQQFLLSKEDNVGRRNRRNLKGGASIRGGSGGTKGSDVVEAPTNGGPNIARAGPIDLNSARGGRALYRVDRDRNPSQLQSVPKDELNGIITDKIQYYYGEPVKVEFEFKNDFAKVDVRKMLNVTNHGQWSMGLYERMQHPLCGNLDGDVDPNYILKVPLDEITDLRPVDPSQVESAIPLSNSIPVPGGESAKRRVLQPVDMMGGVEMMGDVEKMGDVEEDEEGIKQPEGVEDEDEYEMENPFEDEEDYESREPIDLGPGFIGSATFADTTSETLSELLYGTGFHIHLLDENDCPIMGPGGFYLKLTAEMEAALVAAEQSPIDFGVAEFNHAVIKIIGGGETTTAASSTDTGDVMGMGIPDSSGPVMTMGLPGPSGPVMTMNVDAENHPIFTLASTAALDPDTYSVETDYEYYEADDDVIVTIKFNLDPNASRRKLQPDMSLAAMDLGDMDLGDMDLGDMDYNNTGLGDMDLGDMDLGDMDGADIDGPSPVGEVGPDAPDMGGDDENDGFIGNGLEDEEEIDDTDISLFRMGVYQRMQRPQEGVDSALYSELLCADVTACNEVTFTIPTTEFFSVEAGVYGFDIVVVNGKGVAITDPTHFYIFDES